MTAKDRWHYDLSCPKCETTGRVDVSENDGYAYLRDQARHVKVTGPFTMKAEGDYRCETCGGKATTS